MPGKEGEVVVEKVNKQTIKGKLPGFEPNKHTSKVCHAASQ